MEATIVIIVCGLLLLAYLFDITAPRTRIPAVVLLLILGWVVRQSATLLEINVPRLTPILPILGTVGLILIVLEGSLELELNRSKLPVITRTLIVALIPLLILTVGWGWLLAEHFHYPLRQVLLNMVPLSVISSSIAISAARGLARKGREFIVYESSLSDIFGVLCFNFLAINKTLDGAAVGDFSLKLLLIISVSFVATVMLSYMMNKIDHHIKFAPIILLIILIYELSKVFHLPGLLFILLFGLFLGNLDEFKNVRWIQKLRPDTLDLEVKKFREITTEATFLIRSLFFLLFGFLIEKEDLLNLSTLKWSVMIVISIYVVRIIVLLITRTPLLPYLFIAPRGLITILLFFAISPSEQIGLINKSVVLQVIVFTSLMLTVGMMTSGSAASKKVEKAEPPAL